MFDDVAKHLPSIVNPPSFFKQSSKLCRKNIDLEQAEKYAHEFACKKLKQAALRMPMGFYLAVGLPELATVPVNSASRAAIAMQESDEFSGYKRFAGEYFDFWMNAQEPPCVPPVPPPNSVRLSSHGLTKTRRPE